jgi:hypothetical protein
MAHYWSLFVPVVSEEPYATIIRLLDEDEAGVSDPTLAGAEYRRQQQVVQELVHQAHPLLATLELPLRDIATFGGVTEEAVRTIVQHIKAHHVGMGVQVMLADTMIGVRLPYWYSGTEAEAVLQILWTYFRWLEQVAGYRVYDEQLDQVVDLDADFEQVLVAYTGGTTLTHTLQ